MSAPDIDALCDDIQYILDCTSNFEGMQGAYWTQNRNDGTRNPTIRRCDLKDWLNALRAQAERIAELEQERGTLVTQRDEQYERMKFWKDQFFAMTEAPPEQKQKSPIGEDEA